MPPAPRVIVPGPLSPAAFAPFGQVLAAGLGAARLVNQGTAERWDWLAAPESSRPGARANVAAFRCRPRALPLEVALLEKHPCSTQAFVPMACARYLVCAAPAGPDGLPDLRGLRAFVGGPGQGVNLGRDVWHHPIVALDAPAEFIMWTWEDGTAPDCVTHALPPAERTTIVPSAG